MMKNLTSFENFLNEQNMINEGAMEDINLSINNQLKSPKQTIANNLNIELERKNVLRVSPKNNPDSFMRFKVEFRGKKSFDIKEIDLGACHPIPPSEYAGVPQPVIAFELKNEDFPLTWGAYKILPGCIGYVWNKKTNKWIEGKDVQTNLVGQIDHEIYGYSNYGDVQLKLSICTLNKVVSEILKDLQKNKFTTVSRGIPKTGLEITISKVA